MKLVGGKFEEYTPKQLSKDNKIFKLRFFLRTMKRTDIYKKTYKIETSRDPEARGEEYIPGLDDLTYDSTDNLTDKLEEICTSQEREFDVHKIIQDYSFIFHGKGMLIKIDVTGDKFDRKYERTVSLEITPGNRAIPKDITELLEREEFMQLV